MWIINFAVWIYHMAKIFFPVVGELEDGEDWVVLRNCKHEFHRECMAKWIRQMKSSCPTYRAAMWPKTPDLADMV